MKRAVVTIIMNSKGEVLLLQRSNEHQLFPKQWCFPGGKCDAQALMYGKVLMWETYEEAAYRETYEETGIRISSFHTNNEFLADDGFIIKVFHATTDDAVTAVFPNREHTTYGWFKPEEFPPNTGKLTIIQLRKLVHQLGNCA